MPTNDTPGSRIARLRSEKKLSQEELAERAGLSLEQVSALEADSLSGLAPLVKVARGLGVRMGTFMDRNELGPVITRSGMRLRVRLPAPQEEYLDFRSLAGTEARHGSLFMKWIPLQAKPVNRARGGGIPLYPRRHPGSTLRNNPLRHRKRRLDLLRHHRSPLCRGSSWGYGTDPRRRLRAILGVA